MKFTRITFVLSIIAFFLSWGIKANMPIERPSNIETDLEKAWYEKEYTHIYNDDEWYLSTADPNNYTLVEGYDNIYQCKKTDGSIVYYRAKLDNNGNTIYIEIEDFIP